MQKSLPYAMLLGVTVFSIAGVIHKPDLIIVLVGSSHSEQYGTSTFPLLFLCTFPIYLM